FVSFWDDRTMAENPTVQLHVLIVGGGIAGLAAARALKKCGHRVEVFERSHFANEVGAAVSISPNGTKVLRELDFDFAKGGGVNQRYIHTYDAITFAKISEYDYGDLEETCGATIEAMHRRDLHAALWDLALQNDGPSDAPAVKLHTGVKITKIDVESAKIELEDGSVFEGDLLIGADGLRSQIFRFLLPTEAIVNDPETSGMRLHNIRVMYDIEDQTTGPKLRCVWYECRNGEVQNLAGLYRGDRYETKEEDFGHPAPKDKFLEIFSSFNPKLRHIFEKADEIIYWRIYERLPLPTFIYSKTLLIGDAGHPMTPFTAQGATQALEDAGALLGLFKNISSKEQLSQRLEMYERVRWDAESVGAGTCAVIGEGCIGAGGVEGEGDEVIRRGRGVIIGIMFLMSARKCFGKNFLECLQLKRGMQIGLSTQVRD
ncbi:FAD-dependent monooxygenase OpS4, partial [Lachnellula suecica]